jgi:hypothetical protein
VIVPASVNFTAFGNQVAEHLAHARGVAVESPEGLRIEVQLAGEALVRGAGAERVQRAFDDGLQVERRAFEVELARLDLRQVKDVVQQVEERRARLPDHPDAGPLVRREVVVLHGLGHAQDAVEGRADLVAGDGEEAALGAAGGLGGLQGGAQGVAFPEQGLGDPDDEDRTGQRAHRQHHGRRQGQGVAARPGGQRQRRQHHRRRGDQAHGEAPHAGGHHRVVQVHRAGRQERRRQAESGTVHQHQQADRSEGHRRDRPGDVVGQGELAVVEPGEEPARQGGVHHGGAGGEDKPADSQGRSHLHPHQDGDERPLAETGDQSRHAPPQHPKAGLIDGVHAGPAPRRHTHAGTVACRSLSNCKRRRSRAPAAET